MLQIQSLSLGNLCIPVATSHSLNVLQTSTLPPLSWDNSVVAILLISQSLVDTWIPQSHYVVQRATGQYNRGNSLWILSHGGEETAKSVGHDAKGIFHHPSGTRQSVVKDPLLIGKSSSTKSSPIRKYGISRSSPGNGSASGTSKVPSIMPEHKSQSLKICASELDPLVPTSTQRNLYLASTRARSIME